MNNKKIIKSLILCSMISAGYANAAVIITQQSPLASMGMIQQQNQDVDQSSNVRPESPTNTAARQQQNQQSDASTQQASQPQNAFDQGYGEDDDSDAMRRAYEDYQANHTARQMGEQIPVPRPINVVANDRSSAVWLINWKGLLVEKAGVSAQKVDFESRRLTKSEFEKWASRQYRFTNPNDSYVSP